MSDVSNRNGDHITTQEAQVTRTRSQGRGRIVRLDTDPRRNELKRLLREGRYRPEASEIARAIIRYLAQNDLGHETDIEWLVEPHE